MQNAARPLTQGSQDKLGPRPKLRRVRRLACERIGLAPEARSCSPLVVLRQRMPKDVGASIDATTARRGEAPGEAEAERELCTAVYHFFVSTTIAIRTSSMTPGSALKNAK